jgi:hypothetical protein
LVFFGFLSKARRFFIHDFQAIEANMFMVKPTVLFFFLFLFLSREAWSWGFFAHQRINRLAVFCLPEPMAGFFKRNIVYLTENAVNPDRRRGVVKGEAPKHFIDIDVYGDSALWKMPRRWQDAVAKYTEDTLLEYGIVPWEVNKMKYQLQQAFEKKDARAILRIASDLGHYIADSNVPLHTTQNYNGQMTNQKGIHGFWEGRLPELFSDKYDYFVGQAAYERQILTRSWSGVIAAHSALDSVLVFERDLNQRWPADKKYSFELRGNVTTQVYSREYSKAYHQMLGQQVERRMRASIRQIADFWYTAWVDAGQPNLEDLIDFRFSEEDLRLMEEERKSWQLKTIQVRPEESASITTEELLYGTCCNHDHSDKDAHSTQGKIPDPFFGSPLQHGH